MFALAIWFPLSFAGHLPITLLQFYLKQSSPPLYFFLFAHQTKLVITQPASLGTGTSSLHVLPLQFAHVRPKSTFLKLQVFSTASSTSYSSQCSLVLAILPLQFYTLIDHRRCVGIDSLKYDLLGPAGKTTAGKEKSFYFKYHRSSSSALLETRQNGWDEIPTIFK